jgi:hypothetical protein
MVANKPPVGDQFSDSAVYLGILGLSVCLVKIIDGGLPD